VVALAWGHQEKILGISRPSALSGSGVHIPHLSRRIWKVCVHPHWQRRLQTAGAANFRGSGFTVYCSRFWWCWHGCRPVSRSKIFRSGVTGNPCQNCANTIF